MIINYDCVCFCGLFCYMRAPVPILERVKSKLFSFYSSYLIKLSYIAPHKGETNPP